MRHGLWLSCCLHGSVDTAQALLVVSTLLPVSYGPGENPPFRVHVFMHKGEGEGSQKNSQVLFQPLNRVCKTLLTVRKDV